MRQMKMNKMNKDAQSGVVLFIAMVMVLILASLTVTTAQVTRQATKFAQANSNSIRSELHAIGMQRDAKTALGFITGEVAVPAGNGDGSAWSVVTSARAAQEVTAAADDNSTSLYFMRLAAEAPENSAYLPPNAMGCVGDNNAILPLTLGHVSHTAPGGVAFSLNARGHCQTYLTEQAPTPSPVGLGVVPRRKVTEFSLDNLAQRDVGQPWLRYDWLDFDTQDLPAVNGCGDAGDCLTSGQMGNNNPVLRGQLESLYNEAIDDSTDTANPIKNYLNYIGPADGGGALPEYMMETTSVNPGVGAGAGAAGLMIAGAGGSLAGAEPVTYLHRITFVGYGGYNVETGRRLSNSMGRVVIRTVE